MSNWKLIKAETTTNLGDNPSVETATTGWTADGVNVTIAQTGDEQKFGAYSVEATVGAGSPTGAANSYAAADVIAVAAATEYTFSLWYMIPTGGDGVYSAMVTGYASQGGITVLTADGAWHRYEHTFTASGGGGNLSVRVYVSTSNTAQENFYIDAFQAEQLGHATTYCDGDQPGCEWNGAKHNSTSTRSAQSRKGGVLKDLDDDYNFVVTRAVGVGDPAQNVVMDAYASQPGGELNNIGIGPRTFSLVGYITGAAGVAATLHANRQSLLDELNSTKYTQTPQPVVIRYTGAAVDKEIEAYYTGGMEGNLQGTGSYENMTLDFTAPDPWFYEVGESSQVLDSNDAPTLRYLAGRLKSTGQWDDLGLTNNPGGNGSILAICVASDNTVYFGGNFTDFNQTGTGIDYIVRYDPATDTFSRVGGANDFSSNVQVIVEGPDGTIYAGGYFTNCASVPAADYLAQWNGSAWSAVGTPNTGAASINYVNDLAFDSDGKLVIVGLFDNFGDVANADGVAVWDGSSYSALGAPAINVANAEFAGTVAVASNNDVYIGGNFTQANGAPADYGAMWDASASSWGAIGPGGISSIVHAIVIDSKDIVYLGGVFTNLGDSNGDYIVSYNGTAFQSLSTGMDGNVHHLFLSPDGMLFASGAFASAGGITVSKFARWNGASWANVDVDLPGTPIVYDLKCSHQDRIIAQNYNTFIGFTTTGAAAIAGKATTTNNGTATAYPKLVVDRSGGTSARLISCRNETTGRGLLFDYDLLDGEEITIDTHPFWLSQESDFLGAVPGAELAGDDLGDFALLPGANNVTCFVDVVGAPTVVAYLLWKNAYRGID